MENAGEERSAVALLPQVYLVLREGWPCPAGPGSSSSLPLYYYTLHHISCYKHRTSWKGDTLDFSCFQHQIAICQISTLCTLGSSCVCHEHQSFILYDAWSIAREHFVLILFYIYIYIFLFLGSTSTDLLIILLRR